VYVVMAERPAVFTVAPWGYRVLVPSVVHAMGFRNVVRGFKIVSFTAMVAAGGLLFLFLRRRGATDGAALLGTALFALSPPVARAVETPFFQEPVATALILALLLGIEAGAGWGTLALLSALVTLTKDGAIVLTLVPAVLLARWRTDRAGALAGALAMAIPATLFGPVLRWWWTPTIPRITAERNFELVRVGWATLQRVWEPTALAALVGGLLPLAIVGALQPKAREHLRRYGVSLGLLIGLAFLGWLNVPSREPVPLFGDNFERLLIYSVPLLLPLMLAALDRLWPVLVPPPVPRPPRRQIVPAAAALFAIVLPFVLVDRYRRVDLQGSRDGPLVLALCRETWRMATRLAAGDEVVLDPESSRFTWSDGDGAPPTRMRWFLREGWGDGAHYDTGPVVMRARAATVLLPALAPADLEVRLHMVSPSPVPLALGVNGHSVGSWRAGPEDKEQAFLIPARYLVRGDNLVTVSSPEGSLGARLLEIRYRQKPAA
jgi:hypothetical protein